MKLVIFDCDGTLVDSQHEIGAKMKEAFDNLGVIWPGQEATRQCIGLSLPQTMLVLHPDGSEKVRETLVQAYKEFSFQSVAQDPAQLFYDGALEAISRLRERDDVLLAIATGKSQRGVSRILENANLPRNAFVSVQTADDAPSKPHPAMILQAMAEAGGLNGRQTIMVGDASFDMEMARSAGAFALGVEWGYHTNEQLLDAGAQKIINDFSQLDDVVNEFWES